MKKLLAVSLGITLSGLAIASWWAGLPTELPVTVTAQAQEDSSAEPFSMQQLDNLLAPIALYPDPLLAQILLAATFVDQLDEAARWMRAYNDTSAIDDQSWDVSVKAVAHYPSVLYMMSDQIDWTTSLGQAYVWQSTDVMISIQRLRAMAHSAGNLVTNEQQQVDVDGDYINIVPAQPQYIYIPTYNPYFVYFGPGAYYGLYPPGLIYFSPPFPIGVWLNHDCDWHRHRIYYHGWHGRGWIERSRPHIHITNVYVNPQYTVVPVNRDIVHRHVNYTNLNRYRSIHRDVNYNNLVRDKGADLGRANTGNKIIRRNLDVTDPRLDIYHGRAPSQPAPAQLEKRPSPPQTRSEPKQPIPGVPSRPPQVVRPAPQQPPASIQRPPNTVFGSGGGGFDPRAASQRGQESRGRVSQPTARPQPSAPAVPPTRAAPSVPGRR